MIRGNSLTFRGGRQNLGVKREDMGKEAEKGGLPDKLEWPLWTRP
jgi:hypothetical protein